MKFFKNPPVFLIVFLAAILSIFLHNLVSFWLKKEEVIFFTLSLIIIGVGIVPFLIWFFSRLRRVIKKIFGI